MTPPPPPMQPDLATALVASRERYRAVLHAALDAVVAIDHQGLVLEWSPAAERTFGWPADAVTGREMAELIVPPRLRDAHRAGLARYVAGGAPVMLDRRLEITAVRQNGEEFPCELTITRIAHPGDPVFVGYLRDITDRHRADADLRASRARIVEAADEARRRIERDLHDGAQQHLVGLALTLRLARGLVREHPEQVEELLDEAIDDLALATRELRELARGIHPAVLTEGGLEPALAGLVGRAPVPVAVDAVPAGRLPAAVEATAYFVVSEALTNVARHAEATGARVALTVAHDVLTVEVRDDGRGGADARAGSGLRGLADRVAALDGSLAIVTSDAGGTILRVELPCAS